MDRLYTNAMLTLRNAILFNHQRRERFCSKQFHSINLLGRKYLCMYVTLMLISQIVNFVQHLSTRYKWNGSLTLLGRSAMLLCVSVSVSRLVVSQGLDSDSDWLEPRCLCLSTFCTCKPWNLIKTLLQKLLNMAQIYKTCNFILQGLCQK